MATTIIRRKLSEKKYTDDEADRLAAALNGDDDGKTGRQEPHFGPVAGDTPSTDYDPKRKEPYFGKVSGDTPSTNYDPKRKEPKFNPAAQPQPKPTAPQQKPGQPQDAFSAGLSSMAGKVLSTISVQYRIQVGNDGKLILNKFEKVNDDAAKRIGSQRINDEQWARRFLDKYGNNDYSQMNQSKPTSSPDDIGLDTSDQDASQRTTKPRSPNAGIPSQMTHGMRRALDGLGYTTDEIKNMKPADAWARIKNKIPSTQQGDDVGKQWDDFTKSQMNRTALPQQDVKKPIKTNMNTVTMADRRKLMQQGYPVDQVRSMDDDRARKILDQEANKVNTISNMDFDDPETSEQAPKINDPIILGKLRKLGFSQQEIDTMPRKEALKQIKASRVESAITRIVKKQIV